MAGIGKGQVVNPQREKRREQRRQRLLNRQNQRQNEKQKYGVALGGQLQRRLAAGNVSEAQAIKTAQQRNTFKAAFGPNWREKVYGQNVGALRQGLAGGKAQNPQYQAAYSKSLARRKTMLGVARRKLGTL